MSLYNANNRTSRSFLNNFVFYFYAALMVGMFFILRSNSIGMPVRIAFYFLTLLPVFLKPNILPFALVMFYTCSVYSFFPILPTEWYYYIFVFLFLAIFCHKKPFNSVYALLFIYFILLDILNLDISGVNNHFFWMIMAVMISGFFITKDGLESAALVFIIVALFLSIEYVLFREKFLYQFGSHVYGLERGGWTNPNAYGGMISIGAGLAVGVLSGVVRVLDRPIYKGLCLATIIISVIALVYNASRGALVTFTVASVLYIVFSPALKISMKAIFLAAFMLAAVLIIKTGIAELLLFRISDADNVGSVSGRSSIWLLTIGDFFSNSNFFELLFGVGYSDCCAMIKGQNSTHNDFVTALVAYGLLGFIIFCSIVLGPFATAKKKNKVTVLTLTIPLFLECMVLEPLFRGYIIYFSYYFFILSYSLYSNKYSNEQ